MQAIEDVYGTDSFATWNDRRRGVDPNSPDDLRDARRWSGWAQAQPPLQVTSYRNLVKVCSFFTVMNKRSIALYRGQHANREPMPTMSRPCWHLPKDAAAAHPVVSVDLTGSARGYYWSQLSVVDRWVLPALESLGLPRHQHLLTWRAARWAVIAHYELWPTPLLDFTTSLRVAASFALHDNKSGEGFVYLAGVTRLRSDLMDFKIPTDAERKARVEPELDKPEIRAGAVAMRLDAVCPPSALRPHLQSGVLVGNYPFPEASFVSAKHSAGPIVIAAFRLVDDGTFWAGEPEPHRAFLSPTPEEDPLLALFRATYRYPIDNEGRLRPPD